MRGLRAVLIFKLGFLAGVATGGAFMRRVLPSRGDDESDELALVAVFNGIDLKSHAKSFRGGSMVAWFGGIAVDLRNAELAPGARLTVHTLLGGIAIKTPPGWRIESTAKALAGGVDVRTTADDDPDAPVLKLDGTAMLGGIAVGAKAGPS